MTTFENAICPHGITMGDCSDIWCVSRLEDLATHGERAPIGASTKPVPRGQSVASYWQDARTYYMKRGHDRRMAGELAWLSLERDTIQERLKVYPVRGAGCAHCGADLKSARSTKTYCSPTCRKRVQRRKVSR